LTPPHRVSPPPQGKAFCFTMSIEMKCCELASDSEFYFDLIMAIGSFIAATFAFFF
jgi:hypothetical protein